MLKSEGRSEARGAPAPASGDAGIELLDDPPRWRTGLTLRGLETLHVRLTP